MIRRARLSDAEAIAEVHIVGWRLAYRGQFAKDLLDAADVKKRARHWERWLGLTQTSTFVAAVNGTVVGFCSLTPSRDEGARVGEIQAIYLLPSRWRQGIGRQLCERTLAEARERAFEEVSLWVLDANESARRFYEALGFRGDGKTKVFSERADGTAYELRYRRSA